MKALAVVAAAVACGLTLDDTSAHVEPDGSRGFALPEQTPASRVIDRTFACTLPLHAGDRRIEIEARSAQPGQTNHLGEQARPYVIITTGGGLGAADGVAGIQGGRVTRHLRVTMWIHLTHCRASAQRPALGSRGLPGGQASPFLDSYSCRTSRRVLVRVRGVFASPTRLRATRSNFLGTPVSLRDGRVVVTTLAGRPVVYATVAATGKATLFVDRDCLPG